MRLELIKKGRNENELAFRCRRTEHIRNQLMLGQNFHWLRILLRRKHIQSTLHINVVSVRF